MSDSLVGKTIGGYEILEEVGQGGMATVYRAHQLSMDRDVAIKVLPPEFLRRSVSLDRFKQEASIVARLEHRAIVPVHDYGEHEGIPYIVMRYMDGGSVDDLLAKGSVPPDLALSIVQQIAPALDYAHREDVIHRDLKPSNILLDSNGDAYITDFGIARILRPDARSLTTTGVVGTPSYMSPEQAQGHDLDGRSDIYALGVVLFEMLVGARPFEGDTPYSVAVKHVTAPVPSACALNPALTHAVEQVLYTVLAKKPVARYATAAAMVRDLQAALSKSSEDEAEFTVETEPSLNEALRVGAARRGIDTSAPMAPDLQVMPAYVSPPSPSYSRALGPVKPHRKKARKRGSLPSWLTWVTVAVLLGSIVIAVVIGGVYYYVNSDGGGGSSGASPVDYGATAIFKLTATRAAIDTSITPASAETLPVPPPATRVPTIPPTNTLSPTRASVQP